MEQSREGIHPTLVGGLHCTVRDYVQGVSSGTVAIDFHAVVHECAEGRLPNLPYKPSRKGYIESFGRNGVSTRVRC